MNLLSKKFVAAFSSIGMAVLSLTGCIGTTALSKGITSKGHVEPQNIVFPDLSTAWSKDGQFPNIEDLKNVRKDVTKDELYQILGRPDFNEAHNAREWDYIMKFQDSSDNTQICQYKIIFDDNYRGQEFYWNPSNCVSFLGSKPVETRVVNISTPVVARPELTREKVAISSDALFAFDKYKESDMLQTGRSEVQSLASKLTEYQKDRDVSVVVTGHTDRLGSDSYNMSLSQLRAQTVKSIMVRNGVDSKNIIAVGAGNSEPIKDCSANLPRNQQISCLRENRRVVVDVTVN